jgi:hypothetical protein
MVEVLGLKNTDRRLGRILTFDIWRLSVWRDKPHYRFSTSRSPCRQLPVFDALLLAAFRRNFKGKTDVFGGVENRQLQTEKWRRQNRVVEGRALSPRAPSFFGRLGEPSPPLPA